MFIETKKNCIINQAEFNGGVAHIVIGLIGGFFVSQGEKKEQANEY